MLMVMMLTVLFVSHSDAASNVNLEHKITLGIINIICVTVPTLLPSWSLFWFHPWWQGPPLVASVLWCAASG